MVSRPAVRSGSGAEPGPRRRWPAVLALTLLAGTAPLAGCLSSPSTLDRYERGFAVGDVLYRRTFSSAREPPPVVEDTFEVPEGADGIVVETIVSLVRVGGSFSMTVRDPTGSVAWESTVDDVPSDRAWAAADLPGTAGTWEVTYTPERILTAEVRVVASSPGDAPERRTFDDDAAREQLRVQLEARGTEGLLVLQVTDPDGRLVVERTVRSTPEPLVVDVPAAAGTWTVELDPEDWSGVARVRVEAWTPTRTWPWEHLDRS